MTVICIRRLVILFAACLTLIGPLAENSLAELRANIVQTYRSPYPTIPGWTDGFGMVMATIGDKLVVGAEYADSSGVGNSGSVYIYDTATGELLREVVSPQPLTSRQFGGVLSVSGDNILVGSPLDYENGDNGYVETGRAFLIDPDTGEFVRTFNSPDVGAFYNFGLSVAGGGRYNAVASRFQNGTVYILDENSTTPIRLTDPLGQQGVRAFGESVFIDEAALYVPGRNLTFGQADRVYRYSVADGQSRGRIDDPTPESKGAFGYRMSIVGDMLAIAEPFYSYDDAEYAGIIYLFDKATRQLLLTIPNPDPDAYDGFGWTMTAYGDDIVIGGQTSQQAYLFDTITGQMLLEFQAPAEVDEQFAMAVATIGDDLLISADDVVFRYHIVPEPSSLGMLAFAVTSAGARLKFRKLRHRSIGVPSV